MSVAETLDVAIVARDEANHIAQTLASIQRQEADARYRFHVTVAADACEDDTAERAQAAIDGFAPRPDISFRVLEIAASGKNNAINTVLAETASEHFIYGDGDATFSANCFRKVAETLENPAVWACGPVSRQIIHPDLLGTALGNLHMVRQLYIEYSRSVPAPIGRLLGFRRRLLNNNKIPLDALAEERYITLTAIQKYGRSAVETIRGASVYATAARTMEDFLQIGDRIATVRKLFVAAYPELGELLRELSREASRRAPPRHAVERLLIPRLVEEGIDPSWLQEWYRIQAGAKPREELIRADGTWLPASSTK